MHCYVYKGGNNADHYLFLPKQVTQSTLSNLPAALVDLLGQLSLVTDFDLSEKKLAQADSEQVISDMRANGYYLQMPKKDMWLEEQQYFS